MKEMKIAKIIDTKRVVINAGADRLVVGDTLEIIDKFGTDPVIDPDTGEELGTLDVLKGKVIVTQVYPHMAIAESPKKKIQRPDLRELTNFGTREAMSRQFSSIMGTQTIQDDLNVNPDQISGGLPKNNNPLINVGDIVIKRNTK